MGGCICKPETAAPWLDLPPEIAGLIFCRLTSYDDRRTFGAVCSQWRLVARQQSPPPPDMPCINLGHGAYQSLIGGKVRRFPAPKGYRAGASFGDWIFYYHEGSGRCFLGGPFTGAAIKIPTHYRKSLVDFPAAMDWALGELPRSMLIGRGMDMKMVVCSSDLVIALIRHPHQGFFQPYSCLASFRVGQGQLQGRPTVWSFEVQPHDPPVYVYTDIAFYQGKVLALSCLEELFCHELFIDGDMNNNLLPVVHHGMDTQLAMYANCYLVASSDQQKLFMVRWSRSDNDQQAMDLSVFEADFNNARWLEVKDLGDQVLFLGRNCSMAFAAGSSEHWGQRFRGGNRVFVLGTDWWAWSPSELVPCKDIPSYCVYDMTSGETSMVSLEGAHYMERCTPGWFFP